MKIKRFSEHQSYFNHIFSLKLSLGGISCIFVTRAQVRLAAAIAMTHPGQLRRETGFSLFRSPPSHFLVISLSTLSVHFVIDCVARNLPSPSSSNHSAAPSSPGCVSLLVQLSLSFPSCYFLWRCSVTLRTCPFSFPFFFFFCFSLRFSSVFLFSHYYPLRST